MQNKPFDAGVSLLRGQNNPPENCRETKAKKYRSMSPHHDIFVQYSNQNNHVNGIKEISISHLKAILFSVILPMCLEKDRSHQSILSVLCNRDVNEIKRQTSDPELESLSDPLQ
jgi:hypothetical protein